MPVRNSVITGALIVGTVATAAGLNLAVMGLERTDANAANPADEIVATPIDTEVELTAAEVISDIDGPAAPPVLAVGLNAPAPVLTETPAPTSAAPGAPSTALTPTTARGSAPSTAEPSSVALAVEPPASVPSSAAAAPSIPRTSSSPPPPPSQPTTQRPATTAPVPTAPPPTAPVSTEYLTYEFEGVASIVVALHDGERLEFWSVKAEDGWAFMVEDRGPRNVKIKFRPTGGGDEAEFEVKFDNGRLKVKREY